VEIVLRLHVPDPDADIISKELKLEMLKKEEIRSLDSLDENSNDSDKFGFFISRYFRTIANSFLKKIATSFTFFANK
jgi:hypothetical protein